MAYNAVASGTMTVQDFLGNLQEGRYWIRGKDYNCNQVKLSDADASKVTDKDFKIDAASLALREFTLKLKTLQIRPAGMGFSSETKAKFTLSLPVQIQYAKQAVNAPRTKLRFKRVNGAWAPIMEPDASKRSVSYATTTIKTLTLFHPCPVRVNNIQYDAVLTLNDPADAKDGDAIIMIPLKGSNRGSVSERFFSSFIKNITTLAFPSDTTGTYPSTDIAVGNTWNLKNVFTLAEGSDGMSKIDDGYYSWDGSLYERGPPVRSGNQIVNGWKPSGKIVRYFMLSYPVNIGMSDLGILTRNLPPTPVETAIHPIPMDIKPLYKAPEGVAAGLECGGIVRESMENPTSEALTALFGTGEGSATDLFKTAGGDKESCDPFAQNASRTMVDQVFTPARALTFLFNFGLVVGLLFGVWLAMFLITQDYDFGYRDFSEQVGKVMGTLAKQASGRTNAPAAPAPAAEAPALNLGALAKSLPLPKKVQALAKAVQ